MKLNILLIIIVMLCSSTSFAQMELKKEDWVKVTKGFTYSENYKELKPRQKSESLAQSQKKSWVSPKLLLIPLIALGVFLVILIIQFIKNAPGLKITHEVNKSASILIDDNPENFSNNDLERLLLDALDKKDYKLAVRIRFLIQIKLLQDKGLITWKKEKTNFDYYFEINETGIKETFRNIVLIFEKVWYANYQSSINTYQSINAHCTTITSLLNE